MSETQLERYQRYRRVLDNPPPPTPEQQAAWKSTLDHMENVLWSTPEELDAMGEHEFARIARRIEAKHK